MCSCCWWSWKSICISTQIMNLVTFTFHIVSRVQDNTIANLCSFNVLTQTPFQRIIRSSQLECFLEQAKPVKSVIEPSSINHLVGAQGTFCQIIQVTYASSFPLEFQCLRTFSGRPLHVAIFGIGHVARFGDWSRARYLLERVNFMNLHSQKWWTLYARIKNT